MDDQRNLFTDPDVPLPPDPGGEHSYHYVQDESLEAYRSALQSLSTKRREILRFLNDRGWDGATNDEGWQALRRRDTEGVYSTPNHYAPIVTHLKEEGLVVWRGDHRETASKNPAKVWVTAKVWVQHHKEER